MVWWWCWIYCFEVYNFIYEVVVKCFLLRSFIWFDVFLKDCCWHLKLLSNALFIIFRIGVLHSAVWGRLYRVPLRYDQTGVEASCGPRSKITFDQTLQQKIPFIMSFHLGQSIQHGRIYSLRRFPFIFIFKPLFTTVATSNRGEMWRLIMSSNPSIYSFVFYLF